MSNAITVRWGDTRYTFAPGASVVIGRDPTADVHITHPAVSRAHAVLMFLDGRWAALDNQSLNGVFVGTERVLSVDIRGGETIRIGHPLGPALAFEIGPPSPFTERPTEVLQSTTATIAISEIDTGVDGL